MNTGKVADKVFPITTFLSDLPSKLFPQPLLLSSSNGPAEGRLVIIGDVHGMRKSLEALLDKVDFDQRKGDHLILAGDLVSKGPDSPGVVDLAIKLGASAVRGNHDNAVLHAAAEINATKDSLLSPGGSTGGPAELECPKVDLPGDTVQSAETQDKNASTTPGKNKRHSPATYHTASALSTRQLDWLAALPLILRIKLPEGLTSSLGDTVVVVHAGLVPNIPLEEQDPHAVMHMRSLVREMDDGNGFTPTESFGEEGWAAEWDRWQDKLAPKTTVIFGHDAKRRLQLGRYTIGLDSACLYGHQLSALVITASAGQIEHQVVQVECADTPIVPTG